MPSPRIARPVGSLYCDECGPMGLKCPGRVQSWDDPEPDDYCFGGYDIRGKATCRCGKTVSEHVKCQNCKGTGYAS